MTRWLRALFPRRVPAGLYISSDLRREFEILLPGQVLNLKVAGRTFSIIEAEELELIVDKAGLALTERAPSVVFTPKDTSER